jgi:hypothetical protein
MQGFLLFDYTLNHMIDQYYSFNLYILQIRKADRRIEINPESFIFGTPCSVIIFLTL